MSLSPRIAAAQYPIEEPQTFGAYLAKLTRWVDDGARHANILVFPEYGGAEAMAIFGPAANEDLIGVTRALQDVVPQIDAHLAKLASEKGVYIVAPSLPVWRAGGYRNTARFHAPSGLSRAQEKLILTPFDREDWKLTQGECQTVFDTDFGRIGIAICYDIEFPNQIRSLAEAGARLILCPSCTDTIAGYWRVRVGAMARALENQCVIVQSPTIGSVKWTRALDVNRGAAGVFAPPDMGFAPEGILALGALDQPGWIVCQPDLSRVDDIRAAGEVRTFRDWPLQRIAEPKVMEFRDADSRQKARFFS